ncbi:MAG: dipeptidase [Gemmatimonadaceae bacterium]
MTRRYLAALLFVQACASSGAVVSPAPELSGSPAVSERAQRIYRDAIVIDTHNDVPSKMIDDGYNAAVRHAPGAGRNQGETDLPRLLESGITGQFLSAWVDAPYALMQPDQSWRRVQIYLDTIHAFVNRHPDRLIFATSARQVRDAKAQGKVAMLIGVEGGHAIESSIANLRELHRRGVRYMTLTWNNGTPWAGAAAGLNGSRTGGLTDFGRDVVREMNRLGMLVDISHVSDSTFFDAVATSTDPVIASHSSARALNSHRRNMSDAQLRAVARNGGVVNVNFYSVFIDPRFMAQADSVGRIIEEETRMLLQRPGSDSAAIRADAERKEDAILRTLPKPPLSILIDHIAYIARVAGVDHVGLGSDFDGVSGLLPEGMDDVTRLPLIAQALLDRGFSDHDIQKILGGNMLRVMDRVLDRQ